MRLLLHICCAPCSLYPLKELSAKKKFEEITGFYYNPNIHPPSEYKLRRDALKKSEQDLGFKVIYPPYNMEEYFKKVFCSREQACLFPTNKCRLCWELRLERTAQFAKENGFNSFTTTLLISPYQKHDLIKEIGNKIALERGLEFYYEDFRTGFKPSQEEAKKKDIYRQKYCGCVFSELERVKM